MMSNITVNSGETYRLKAPLSSSDTVTLQPGSLLVADKLSFIRRIGPLARCNGAVGSKLPRFRAAPRSGSRGPCNPYRPTEGGADAWATNELRLRDGTPLCAVHRVRRRAEPRLARTPARLGR